MNQRTVLQAGAGLLLCALGFFLAHRDSYDVHTVLATAGGCRMATDIYEPRSGTPVGSVVLFHGLAANKKVMAFNAQEFANQDLRVFVPDLPGHGRTPGPYSADRVGSCALALVRDLASRKAIIPERTILAGHSLGGAVAIRTAAQFPVAGVIALSPAPMQTARGFSPEMVPFHRVPILPPHSLVLTGQWEPGPIKSLAQQLVSSSADTSSKYRMIPRTSHVSILFSSETFSEVRSWTSQLLSTDPAAPLPKNVPTLACLLGLAGLSLLAAPFIREMNSAPAESVSDAPTPIPGFLPGLAIIGVTSLAVVLALASNVIPFHFVHVFQGDYLSVFLFLAGLGALALRRKLFPSAKALLATPLASAIASALVLVLLFAAWFELTFYEAWLTPARWLRFPLLFVLVLPWHFSEELLLGDCQKSVHLPRLFKALCFRSVAFLSLLLGILVLHSGEILLFLLLAYFVVFSVMQRLACDLVRFRTRGTAPAAIFGAILLAAFALAIFPVA
jgi:pimeloyl-ACP methyl ester carboxylesterase